MNLKLMSVVDEVLALFGDDLKFSALTPSSIIAAMATSLFCGIIIYLVYRFCYRGVVYSDNFNILLVMITSITGFIANKASRSSKLMPYGEASAKTSPIRIARKPLARPLLETQ